MPRQRRGLRLTGARETSGSWTGPLGLLWWRASERGLRLLHLAVEQEEHWPTEAAPSHHDDAVRSALERYFHGELDALSTLPLDPEGTSFQIQVWDALKAVPPGTTTTYGAIANGLRLSPGAARAVGAAVGANPLALVIPCHRVLGQDGGLTGFRWGLDRKRWLLDHEARHGGGGQPSLFPGR